ncbi:MAG: M23 family metallopeptidase [Mangrovibacterium sp.]
MKQKITLICLLIIVAIAANAQNSIFSIMEINHVRVPNPQLFVNGNKVKISLDSLARNPHSFPLPNARVISPFGTERGRNHAGIDLKTFANDTIRVAFDGVVRMAKSYSGYGNVIVVRHQSGLETVYSHNSKNLVASGDSLKAGQSIALLGRTGRATTEHLHFEVRINGKPIDPNLLFNMDTQALQPGALHLLKTENETLVELLPEIELIDEIAPIIPQNLELIGQSNSPKNTYIL